MKRLQAGILVQQAHYKNFQPNPFNRESAEMVRRHAHLAANHLAAYAAHEDS